MKSANRGREFFESVPDALNSYILVLDAQCRVVSYNRAAADLFEAPVEDVLSKLGGDALGCVHATETPHGCGFSGACGECAIRASVREVLAGKSKVRRRVRMELARKGQTIRFAGVITATPICRDGSTYAVLFIENLDDLLDLRRTLPICMSCRKLKADGETWAPIESYLLHSLEVMVSHGYCPECGAAALRQATDNNDRP